MSARKAKPSEAIADVREVKGSSIVKKDAGLCCMKVTHPPYYLDGRPQDLKAIFAAATYEFYPTIQENKTQTVRIHC